MFVVISVYSRAQNTNFISPFEHDHVNVAHVGFIRALAPLLAQW
jgi:hypothetical protein